MTMVLHPLEDAEDPRDLEFRWLVAQLHARGADCLLGFLLEFFASRLLRTELQASLRQRICGEKWR